MPFRTGQGDVVSLDRVFEAIESLASQIKLDSVNLRDRAAGNSLTGEHAFRYFDNLGDRRNSLQEWVAKISDQADASVYAQDRYNDPTYDAASEFSVLITGIDDTLAFIAANIPTDLLTWDVVGGFADWQSFNSGQTSGLQSQLQSLIDLID